MKLLDYSVLMNTVIHIYNFEGGRNKNGRGQCKLLSSRDLAVQYIYTIQIYHRRPQFLTM
jgi:hypothetical protein